MGLRPFGFSALCVHVECDVAPSLSLPIWTVVAHVLIVGIRAFLVHEHTSRYCAGRSTLSLITCIVHRVMLPSGLLHRWHPVFLQWHLFAVGLYMENSFFIVKHVTVHVNLYRAYMLFMSQ